MARSSIRSTTMRPETEEHVKPLVSGSSPISFEAVLPHTLKLWNATVKGSTDLGEMLRSLPATPEAVSEAEISTLVIVIITMTVILKYNAVKNANDVSNTDVMNDMKTVQIAEEAIQDFNSEVVSPGNRKKEMTINVHTSFVN